MKYNFDEIVNRKGTLCMKHDFIGDYFGGANKDTIPLWVADMDFPCSEAINKAIIKRAKHSVYGYTELDKEKYNKAVKNWFKKRYDFSFSDDEIFYSPGIVPAIAVLINALTKKKDSIIINQPVYTPFINLIKENKRTLINSPLILTENNNYKFDFDDFENKIIYYDVKMYILCSPHNPTGNVWSEEALKRITEICERHNVIIVSDEIHCDITRKGIKHIPIASLGSDYDNIITLTAPSKTFNVAGLKISNAIIKNDFLKSKWNEYMADRLHINGANVFANDVLIAAYTKSDEWYEYMLEYVSENFKYIESYLDKYIKNVKFNIPEATFLGWLDLRAYDIDYDELSKLFVTKGGFAMQHGKQFGNEGTGFYRINVAISKEELKKAMKSLRKVLKDIPLKNSKLKNEVFKNEI